MIPPIRTKWQLEVPTLRDLIVLCSQMRPDEIEQYLALTGAETFDFERAAVGMYSIPGVKFVLTNASGQLLVAGGFEEVRPRVWRSWMTGTMDAWSGHWRSITEASRFVMDCLFEDGAQRIETWALADRAGACRWYEQGLRMSRDGVLPNYAADGRDVVIYSRTINQIRQEAHHGRRKQRCTA